MRFCKVENSKVTNVIKASQEFIDGLNETYIEDDNAQIGWSFVDGSFVNNTVGKTLDELKQQKKEQLHNNVDTKRKAILAKKYSETEIDTFLDQKGDYIAYIRDNSVATPAIDNIADGRGITREAMILKVKDAVESLWQLVGYQQSIEDSINASTTIEDLDLIVLDV